MGKKICYSVFLCILLLSLTALSCVISSNIEIKSMGLEDAKSTPNNEITISVKVTNRGDKRESRVMSLNINDKELTKEIELEPMQSKALTFEYKPRRTGKFIINIGDHSEILEVVKPAKFNVSNEKSESYSVEGRNSAKGFKVVEPFSTSSSAKVTSFNPIGPYGGRIKDLTFHPENENIVFAATEGAGVFRSTDGGDNWEPMNRKLKSPQVNVVAVQPGAPYKIIIGTDNNIFIWEEDKWKEVRLPSVPGTRRITSIAFDPKNPKTIYAGTSAVFKSTDGGESWRMTKKLSKHGSLKLAIDPKNPDIIYAGTKMEGIFRSSNGGKTWERISRGHDFSQVWDLSVNPHQPKTLFAGSNGVTKSIDQGDSWEKVLSTPIKSLAIHPQNTQIIYAGTIHGIYKTNNGGETWNGIHGKLNGERINAIAVDPENPHRVIVGTHNKGIFEKSVYNEDWKSSNNGITGVKTRLVKSFSETPRTLYVGTFGQGLFKTTDSGKAWEPMNKGLSNLYIKALTKSPNNGNLFVGTYSGIFKRSNGGRWKNISGKIGEAEITTITIASRETYETIYAGTYGNGIYKSTDGGDSWTEINKGLKCLYVDSLITNPEDESVVYAGTINGVFKIEDNGISWQEFSSGLQYPNVRGLTVSEEEDTLFLATGDAVYRRSLGDNQWSSISDTLTSDNFKDDYLDVETVAEPGGSQVYVGTWKGLYERNSFLNNWQLLRDGLTNSRIMDVEISEQSENNEQIFIGTYGGSVYKLPLSYGGIIGRVTTKSGDGLAFASVTAKPGGYETRTDARGRFIFSHLPAGAYSITINREGYKSHRKNNLKVNDEEWNYAQFKTEKVNPNLSSNIATITPTPGSNYWRGEKIKLEAFLGENIRNNSEELIWNSDKVGVISKETITEPQESTTSTRINTVGTHRISVMAMEDGECIGKDISKITVQEPEFHTTDLASQNGYIWASSEPVRDMTRAPIYKFKIKDGNLVTEEKFAHPATTADGIAAGGELIWTSGSRGPDPYRPWEDKALTQHFIFQHKLKNNLEIEDSFKAPVNFSLTWDGNNIWMNAINSDKIIKYEINNGSLVEMDRYPTPPHPRETSMHISLAWGENTLWSIDRESKTLYQHKTNNDLEITNEYTIDENYWRGITWSKGQLWADLERGFGILQLPIYN